MELRLRWHRGTQFIAILAIHSFPNSWLGTRTKRRLVAPRIAKYSSVDGDQLANLLVCQRYGALSILAERLCTT